MFTFNPEGRKTILSIDGGGMRGVISLQMLVYLEEQTGQPAYELFDMVAGTSTGAIIGAGLGLGMTAKEIMERIYLNKLPAAFGPRGLGFWARFVMNGMRYMYPNRLFLDSLSDLAAGKSIADLDKLIVLMTTTDLRTGNTYYIVNAGQGALMFQDWPVVAAVAASAAAPIFFQPPLGNFIDGGVGVFGNPCLAAAIEALDYIGFKEEETLLISLGTGFVPNDYPNGTGRRFWLKNWIEYMLIQSILNAAIDQASNTMRFYPKMDFRRYNPALTRDKLLNELGINPDPLDPRKLTLDTTDPAELDLMCRIGQAYAEAIDWSPRRDAEGNLMGVQPWDTVGGRERPGVWDAEWDGTEYS